MLINSINITAGLTDGGYGTVLHIVTRSFISKDNHQQEEIQVILVRFDYSTETTVVKLSSLYKSINLHPVPV